MLEVLTLLLLTTQLFSTFNLVFVYLVNLRIKNSLVSI